MREVGVGIFAVGELERGEIGRWRAQNRRRLIAGQQVAAQFGKSEVALAQNCDIAVGHGPGDFRPADDHSGVRKLAAQERKQFCHMLGIPDIHPDAEDARPAGHNGRGDFSGGLLKGELNQFRLRAQIAHIRQ